MSIARSLITIIAGLLSLQLVGCSDEPLRPSPLRLALPYSDELVLGSGPDDPFGLAVAHDGRRVVMPARRQHSGAVDNSAAANEPAQLWMRDLTSNALTALTGTAGGGSPFWSPDGTMVGFFAAGRLRAFTFADASVRDLAGAPDARGGAWHTNGDIIFARDGNGPLMRRTAGGDLQPFTTLDSGERSHRFPRLLGDTHVVFYVRAVSATRQGIWIAPLDDPAARKRLVNSDAEGIPLESALAYASGEALVLQRINLEALALEGRSHLVGAPVGRSAEHQLFASAGGELLLFGVPGSPLRELRWVDRQGTTTGSVGEPMDAFEVRLAPRATRVAVARLDPQLRTYDIWVYEDQRPVPRRLSHGIDLDDSPSWSPTGDRIAWVSGRRSVVIRSSGATQPEATVAKFEHPVRVTDWAPDGRVLVLSESRPPHGSDITLLPLSPGGATRTRVYTEAPFNETYGVVSPNGRWLAYASDESGRMEIYVDAFPQAGARGRMSVGGGTEPRWAPNGTSLFFRRGNELHVVQIAFTSGTPEATASHRLFSVDAEIRAFDVAADGERFLLNLPAPNRSRTPLTALLHVQSLLPSAP